MPEQPGVELIVTGTAPIVFQARRSLLDGMLFGLGTDVVLIVIAVILINSQLADRRRDVRVERLPHRPGVSEPWGCWGSSWISAR